MSRLLLAGVLLAGVVAGLMAAWWWANDRPACRASTDFGTCTGSGLLVSVVGVPVALLLGWLALRIGGARHAVLGVLCLGAVTWLAVIVAESVEPPAAFWPVVVGVAGVVYLAVERRARAS